jgi:hypothetical protein
MRSQQLAIGLMLKECRFEKDPEEEGLCGCIRIM